MIPRVDPLSRCSSAHRLVPTSFFSHAATASGNVPLYTGVTGLLGTYDADTLNYA
jgi:hypothetical protein